MKNFFFLTALLLAGGAYTYYMDFTAKPDAPVQPATPVTGALIDAPDFSFRDVKGKEHTLAQYKGKVVVLNFWAPWCAPCVEEFPAMLKLASSTKQNTIFLFVSIDEDVGKIEGFVKKYGGKKLPDNVVVGTDKNLQISQKLFQTYALPETYLITPDQKIAQKIIGNSVPWDSVEMEDKVRTLSQQP